MPTDTYVYAPGGVVQGAPYTPQPGRTLAQDFPADMVPAFIDLSTLSPPLTVAMAPVPGSVFSNGAFTPPATSAVQAALNLAQQGPRIVSSGSGLSLTYADGSTSSPVMPPADPNAVYGLSHSAAGHTLATTAGGGTIDAGIANRRGNITYSTAASGALVTIPPGMQLLWLTGTTTVATQPVALPSGPQDGDQQRIASQIAVMALTVQDASGNSVGAPMQMPAASEATFLYTAGAWTLIKQPAAVSATSVQSASGGALRLLFVTAVSNASGAFTMDLTAAGFKSVAAVLQGSIFPGATATTMPSVAITSATATTIIGVVSKPGAAVTLLSTNLLGAPVPAAGVTVGVLVAGS
ncbi:MAG: hypothetical protein ACRYGG_06165 [Janthinobacterium lividum]